VICPYCGADNDKVIDSRASEASSAIRRRRECLACSRRFTTYERVEKTARLMVVKRDGSRVPFDSEKVLRGIQAACGKRAIPEHVKVNLANEIEEQVHREFDREVPSVELGKRIAARLKQIDPIAYIRFASEYYQFRNLEEFAHELRELQSLPRNLPNQTELFTE
jgi:transcriptional repressor NrdR